MGAEKALKKRDHVLPIINGQAVLSLKAALLRNPVHLDLQSQRQHSGLVPSTRVLVCVATSNLP